MTNSVTQRPTLQPTWRHAAAIVLMASIAILGRRPFGGMDSALGAAWFGVIMFGGQTAIVASMTGRLRENPRRTWRAIVMLAVLGIAFGAWVAR